MISLVGLPGKPGAKGGVGTQIGLAITHKEGILTLQIEGSWVNSELSLTFIHQICACPEGQVCTALYEVQSITCVGEL
jgi:hypothetical protein